MSSPKHGRRAAPKPPARTRSTREAAARPTRRNAPEAPARVRTASTRRKRSMRPAFSVLAMTFVGGMMIATSVPALAITATDPEPRASVYAPVEDSISLAPQTIEVASEAEMEPLATEGYAVEAAPPPIFSEVANVGPMRSCGPS
jgi:hypothetical protein